MFPVFPCAQHLLRTQILFPGHKKCFWFCSETFGARNKSFPVCAAWKHNIFFFFVHGNTTFIPPRLRAQETSWATMCPHDVSSFARAFNYTFRLIIKTSRLRFVLQQYPISIKERRFVSSEALWNYTRLEPSGSCLSELTTGSMRHARKFVIKSGA